MLKEICNISQLFQKGCFVLKIRFHKFISFFRKYWYRILGMKVGSSTFLPHVNITWPHQVCIGDNCVFEHDINFKFSGIWSKGPSIRIANNVFIGAGCEFNIQKGINIGDYCNIASGCKFIDHDHGIQAGKLIGPQIGLEKSIILEQDVWLGFNVIVLKGVVIGTGAVVAAGAVVTKSIMPNEIWAGVPARKIGERK